MKRIFKWLALVSLVLLLVASSRIWSFIRFSGNVHIPDVASDFSRLSQVLPPASATVASFKKGLPHPYFETEAFRHELFRTRNTSIHGYRFYTTGVMFDVRDGTLIASVLTNPASYRPYSPGKGCGGYHADFAVRLSHGKSQWDILVCLGCHEVLVFAEEELICELTEGAHVSLVSLFNDLTKVP